MTMLMSHPSIDFIDTIGRPESPDKYSFNILEGGDEKLLDWFRDTAHQTGLTGSQATKMFNNWNEMTKGRTEDAQDQMRTKGENDIDELKKEWGDKYDQYIMSGKNAVRALGYDEPQLSTMEEKLGTSEMLKLFSVLGSKMGEDSFEDGSRSNASFGNSQSEARVQMEELKNDDHFMSRYMSGDKDAVAKYTRIMRTIYS
ncbi:MAG: hypothetical protein KZQ71_13605 [Candidatus Thiodiazotropha sp. (ex Lucinoma aequizonata)]|nr:hypothetical protein [Candidatus Thiodiazotropha sp. (ex Lucinoma aequizonata)]